MTNYFASSTAAGRYARGRPYFHPLVALRLKAAHGGAGFARALDVGCGTGQSSRALAEIADAVVGADVSAAMLAEAGAHARVTYVEAPAEKLPFADGAFDLLSAGLAFHWFAREAFLAEARRLLGPGGWLAVYNDGFTGEMAGNPAFAAWNREQYLQRYPTPPRNAAPFTDDQAARFGFGRVARESFAHDVALGPEELVSYLLTQSNVIAAVELGAQDIQSVAQWLMASVRPLFRSAAERFAFFCVIDIFERTA